GSPAVLCHPGKRKQVSPNLIANAAQAIAQVVGDSERKGRIGIRTRREGDAALVAISDSGAGIPDDVQARIFEPFFTTKAVGRGTGQGLAIAHGVVVDRHGGALTFETARDSGATFLLRLPIPGPPGTRPREDAP